MTATTSETTTNGSVSGRLRTKPSTEVIAARRRHNRTRIIIGLLVSAVAIYGIAAKFREAGDRISVLVVAREVPEGSVIQAADLREALLSPDDRLRTVLASQRSQFVGKVAAVDLLPGTNVTEASIAKGPVVGPEQVVVGATLRPGRFPAELRTGDAVRLLRVPVRSENATGTVVAARAVVRRVVKNDEGLGTTDVALIVQSTEHEAVAGAAARDELVIVGLGPQA